MADSPTVAGDPLDDAWHAAQGGGKPDPLDAAFDTASHDEAIRTRRKTVSAASDTGRGFMTGLADTGYSFAQGMTWLANQVPGVNLDDTEASLQRSRQEAHEFYDAQGTAGTVGTVAGRVVGEGAALMGESAGVARAAKALAPRVGAAAKLSSAIEAGREGSFAQRVAAQVVPGAPLDFVTGAGDAAPGESRVKAGLKNVAIGAILPTAIEGAVSTKRVVTKAVQDALDVSGGALEHGVSGVGETVAHDTDELKNAIDTEQARKVDATSRDPLNAMNAGLRRVDDAATADIADRTAVLGTSTGERADIKPATPLYFDATGRPVAPPVPLDQTVKPLTREPLTESVPVFKPKADAPIETTQVRKLDASQGGRHVEDGMAQPFEQVPAPSGANMDAVHRIELVGGYRTRKGALPMNEPQAPRGLLSEGTGERIGTPVEPTPTPEVTGPNVPPDARWAPLPASTVEAEPTPLKFDSARSPSGSLRKNLTNVREDALSDELRSIDEARAAERPGYHVTSPEHQVGHPWSGFTPGGAKALGRIKARNQAFNRIGEELERRGISVEDALADATERHRLYQAGGPEVDKASGELKDENGFTLFSHPTIGGAIAGGAIGGRQGDTDEERARNMLLGAAAGAVGVAAGAKALPKLGEASRGVRTKLAETIAPELATERRALDRAANSDAMTGLGNARAYGNVVKAADQNPEARVIRFDLNGFKGVNDRLGHAAGDDALKNVAEKIRTSAPGLPAFRVGGDEFAVVVHANDAERVRNAIESAVGVVEKDGARYSISGGIGSTDAEADAAAYLRKAEHKGAQGIAERGSATATTAAPATTDATAPAPATAPVVTGNQNDGAGLHALAPVAVAGAAGGSQGDTAEDRFRNAIGLAAVAVVGGVAARKAFNAATGKVTLSAMTKDAEAAIARIEGKIDFDGSIERGVGKQAAGSLTSRVSRLADALSNGAGAIERLGRMAGAKGLKPTLNPGELLSYVKASDRTVRDFYNHGVVNALTRDVAGPSFKSLFERFGQDDDAIRKAFSYVVAKRDVGRGLAGVGGDAVRLSDAHALTAWGDADPVMKEFADEWKQYVDGIGQYAVDSGLWTKPMWDKMQASDALYVRYKRIIDSPARAGNSTRNVTAAGQKLANVTAGVQSFQGSTRAISNPAEAMAEYTAAIIRRADRYRVGAGIFDAVDTLGDEGQLLMTRVGNVPAQVRPLRAAQTVAQVKSLGIDDDVLEALDDTFAPIVDPKNPVIWRNSKQGSREYAVVHSADLWNAMAGLQVEKDAGAFRAFADVTLRPLRRIFTAATTGLSPRFALATNPVRDVLDAMFKTESGVGVADIARGYSEGIKDLFGKSDIAEEAARAGLGGTSMFGGDLNPGVVARRFAPTSALDKVRSVSQSAVVAPLELAEKLGEASDKSPRIAEYMKALKESRPKVESGEWTVADARLHAAGRARRVTIDFANKPGNKYLRELDDYIPFFGVALKAPVTMAQAAVRNPGRAAAVSAGVGLAAFTAWALQHALPAEAHAKVKDRPATERSGYLLVPLDNTGENLLRVPLGAELGLIAQGVTAGLDAAVEGDPHAGRLLGQAVARTLPPGVGEALIDREFDIPVPGVQQVIENMRNRRSFGGAPVESPRLEGLPPEERRYDTTSPTFDAVAAAGRKLGFSNFSPLQAENLVRGVASSATPLLTNVTDPIAERIIGREQRQNVSSPLARNPLLPSSAVIANPVPASTESEKDFYAINTRAKQAQTLLDQASESGDMGAATTLRKYADVLNPEVQTVLEAVGDVSKQLRTQEVAVRTAVQERQMSPEAGRAQLDKLKASRQGAYRRALDLLRTLNVTP